MKLTIRPLVPELLPALEDLFADSAICRRCWCMYWRIGAGYRKKPDRENRDAFRQVVQAGPPSTSSRSGRSRASTCARAIAGAASAARSSRRRSRRPRRARAPALDAFPFDRALSPSSTSTGFSSTFARAGFEIVARHIPARPIMRHDLRRGTNALRR